jgi:capsular exopolysaccharide synthesis family protein
MERITLKELRTIAKRGLWILITVPLITVLVVGFYYYYCTQNQYTAETRLYVLIDYGDATGSVRYDISTSTSLVGDYQQLIMTHEVLSEAEKRLGVEDFDAVELDISSQDNTRVICLAVTGEDPTFCMNAANTISEVFIEHLATITQTNSVSIASRALKPKLPSGPNRLRNTLLAFVMSFLFVAGLLVLLAKSNTKLRTSDDVEDFLHLPVLARITNCKKEMKKYRAGKGGNKPLFYSVSRDTREGIKTLSMNLEFLSGKDAVRTLAVTSATPSEGKSSISVMLATSLAEDGKRVLLFDMDFRNPTVGKYLGVRNRLDLLDVINGNAEIDQIITKTGVPGLFMVDSYHKCVLLNNMVQSAQYKEFIEAVSHRFDYVILDTPPVAFFSDTAILARIADRTLLVVASGRVERDLEKEIVDQLQKANASIIGVALNLTDARYSHYGHYYRQYGKKGTYCQDYSEVPNLNTSISKRAM